MNLAPSPVQNELARAARQWLARELPLEHSRRAAAGASALPNEGAWNQIADLGWLALALPADHGGLGFGAAEQVMLFRELGRSLAPGPFLPTVLGVHAALAAGAVELAVQLAGGRRRVGTMVTGSVVDGAAGDLAIGWEEDGATLVELIEIEPLESVDPLVRLARVVRATPVLAVAEPLLLARGHVLAAAQLLGIIEAVRDMSVGYAKARTQFGRPIGAFQAVKHRCADMAIAAYASTGQVNQAALYVDDDHPSAPFQAACAYVVAARGAARSAADNIQNHGAIGFTWEHDAHLYLKRATVLANVFGPLRSAHRFVMAPARSGA